MVNRGSSKVARREARRRKDGQTHPFIPRGFVGSEQSVCKAMKIRVADGGAMVFRRPPRVNPTAML